MFNKKKLSFFKIKVVSQHDNLHGLLPVALRVLLHLLGCCQSTALLQNAFATQRALVYKVLKLSLSMIHKRGWFLYEIRI